jgi:DNA-binding GntR family transcriptional regulator
MTGRNTPPRTRKAQYVRVAEDLVLAIEKGRYARGDLLPSEADLCRTYGISNHTVRHAMRVLRERGLAVPEHGRGTRVIATSTRSRFVHTLDSIPDIGELVKDTSIRVLRRDRVDAGKAALPLPTDVPRWLLIEAIRYTRAAEPLVWKHVYIDARYPKAAREVGSSSEPIYKLVEQFYGERIERVEQEVGAVLIDGHAADALQVDAGTPGLLIDRHYRSMGGRVFEVTRSIYPAARFRYHSELRLEPVRGASRSEGSSKE